MARIRRFPMSGLRRGLAPAGVLAGIVSGIVTGVLATTCPAAAAEPMKLLVDQATVLRLSRPADTVVIGNPMIADATVRDDRTLILTGRAFGTTNLIILDRDGNPIAEELVSVAVSDTNRVTVYRGAGRQTLSCTPYCDVTLAVGDDTDVFDAVREQTEGKAGLSSTGN